MPLIHFPQGFHLFLTVLFGCLALQVQQPGLPVESAGPGLQCAQAKSPLEADQGWVLLQVPVQSLQAPAGPHPNVEIKGQPVSCFLIHVDHLSM